MNACSSLFIFGGGMLVSTFNFHGLGCTPSLGINSPKNRTEVHLKWHLSFLNFKFTFLHICSTCHKVLSWSFPSPSYHTTRMSSMMPNTLGRSMNTSSMSPVGAAPNGSFFVFVPAKLTHECCKV